MTPPPVARAAAARARAPRRSEPLLEPFVSPKLGATLNAIGAVAALGLTVLATTVTSVSGSVPIIILAPALALGFASRFFGASIAWSRGEWGMPWGARVTSWIFFGVSAFFLWSAGSLFVVAAYAAFVVLDGAAGFVKREGAPARDRPRVDLRPLWIGTGIVLYLAATAIFYFLVGRFLPIGVLLTWTMLAFGFALLLRLTLVGPKAGEAWLHAPRDHRKHERREKVVVDPQRARAESVLVAFRARGDATQFMDLVREAARSADMADAEANALEQRILASFARGGTRRDEDVVAALDEVEKALALRGAPKVKKEVLP